MKANWKAMMAGLANGKTIAAGWLLACVLTARAQSPPGIQWQKSFGGTAHDLFRSLQQTTDGGYILGGSSGSGVSGNKTSAFFGGELDYWLVKLDATGNMQWDKSFGGSDLDVLFSVRQTSDGGYILGGRSGSGVSSNKTSVSFGLYDYWLVKLDATGNMQWDKSFGGSGSDMLYCVQQTSDGSYILGGESLSDVSGNKTSAGFGNSDFWVVKVDTNGNKQWEQSYGGSGSEDFTRLQQTSDGGYILGGSSGSDGWVVKVDANGNIQWDKSFGGYGLTGLQQTSDGGYILGGSFFNSPGGFRSRDYWVVKVDADGNMQWDKLFGGTGYDSLHTLQQTSDGGYILGGLSDSGVSGNKTSAGFGNGDFWVVKVDTNGNKQWDKSFGGGSDEDFQSLQQTSDGGYILGGTSASSVSGNKTTAGFGSDDLWVVKLAPPLPRFNSHSLDSNRVFHAQLNGFPRTNYIFQASADLSHWTSLLTNSAPDGLLNFSDTNAASFPARFYRVQQEP